MRKRLDELWSKSIFPTVERIKQAIESGQSPEQLADLLERELRIAEATYGHLGMDIVDMWRQMMEVETRTSMHKALAKSLGIDITAVLDTPQVSEALSIGGWEAADLIKTIPGELLNDVAKAVADNFRGIPQPEGRSLMQQIQHIGDVSKKRAKLIARDQTSKMTGLLNQTRQQMLGVEMYIWRTAKDSRVVGNPSGRFPKTSRAHGNHYKMEGKYCKWENPMLYSNDKGQTWVQRASDMPKNHPGQDIACRCFASAVIDLDKILENSQVA